MKPEGLLRLCRRRTSLDEHTMAPEAVQELGDIRTSSDPTLCISLDNTKQRGVASFNLLGSCFDWAKVLPCYLNKQRRDCQQAFAV